MISNDEILKQINKSIITHSRWKLRLEDTIETPDSDFVKKLTESSHNCEFGKWLKREKDNLKRFPEYAKVCAIHTLFHTETMKVIELAISGKSAEAKHSITKGSHFKVISAELTILMTQWKNSL